MHLSVNCPDCGKAHEVALPEGGRFAPVDCDCGARFAHLVLMEPFGFQFVYGTESFAKHRPSDACARFAASFELFEKSLLEALLVARGTPEDVAHLITCDMALSRTSSHQLAKFLLPKGDLRPPNLSVRDHATHKGKVPHPKAVEALARDVLTCMTVWLTKAETLAGPDLLRLRDAYCNGPLPQDVAVFDRRLFDIGNTVGMLHERWKSATHKLAAH